MPDVVIDSGTFTSHNGWFATGPHLVNRVDVTIKINLTANTHGFAVQIWKGTTPPGSNPPFVTTSDITVTGTHNINIKNLPPGVYRFAFVSHFMQATIAGTFEVHTLDPLNLGSGGIPGGPV